MSRKRYHNVLDNVNKKSSIVKMKLFLVVFAKANLEHLINEVKQWRAVIPEFMISQ